MPMSALSAWARRRNACRKSKSFLPVKSIDEAVIAQAQQLASQAVEPGDDIHAGADYRKSLVGTLTARALRDAVTR